MPEEVKATATLEDIVVMTKVKGVVLQMSLADAKVLKRICSFIAGPSDGPRGAADRINLALNGVCTADVDIDVQGEITLRKSGGK